MSVYAWGPNGRIVVWKDLPADRSSLEVDALVVDVLGQAGFLFSEVEERKISGGFGHQGDRMLACLKGNQFG